MSTIIIVESPTKAKSIEAMLGAGYKIVASFGHIRDLPEKSIGASAPDFMPEYVLTETGKKAMFYKLLPFLSHCSNGIDNILKKVATQNEF